MTLARALAPTLLVLSAHFGPAYAASPTPAPPGILIPAEEIHARGIKVLAALLVALTASGPQGVAPPGRMAEAEHLIRDKLFGERNPRDPTPLPRLRQVAGHPAPARHENAAENGNNYIILHTFSELPRIIRLPTSHAFAAPCDRGTRIGWPPVEATECAGLAPRGERMKLSDRLHRRRLETIPDVILGQSAPPSLDRMNLDGTWRTNVPALFIANR